MVRPKLDCAIIPPKNEKRQTRFDSFRQFVFETLFRLIVLHLSDGRWQREGLRTPVRGLDYRVTL